MYHYIAHGLRIIAEFPCPEFAPAIFEDHTADVIIGLGQTPAALEDPIQAGGFYQAKPNQFLLTLDQIQIARFWVQDGKRITIEPAPGSDKDTIRLFLMGSALGALLHQRGQVILHGSAVETERGAVVFVGPSGVGKSTLAATLQQKGYRVLSDDVCSVTYDAATQEALIHPGLAHLKLWADATEQLALTHFATRRVQPDLEKYALLFQDTYDPTPVRLQTVYLLAPSTFNEWQIEPLDQLQKVEALIANTYRQHFLQGLGVRPHHFLQLAQIARQVRLCRVVRPMNGFQIDELVRRLADDWAGRSSFED
jgi:hypothetical protein